MAADKKTIGVTKANAAVLQRLVDAGHFGSELDAAKFAMAFAVRRGVPAGATDGAETKWNVGSVDPDGSLRALIDSFYPDVPDPYRVLEHLVNEGLRAITDGGDIPDVYEILFPTGGPGSSSVRS